MLALASCAIWFLCRKDEGRNPLPLCRRQRAQLDRQAESQDAYVIPTLILSDLEQCANFAQQIEHAGLRALELNIGAPDGEEAAKGANVLERDTDRIEQIVRRIRQATTLPLWIKLTGNRPPCTLS
ncbi:MULTISPECIES: hypothetical protein [unclassified Pseudomonas]|uniref:hypothetical protein n=1 Tax=unclassified Pseudomonas TaxID=196821 RepID=UPI0030D86B8C